MNDVRLQLQALLPGSICHRPWIDAISPRNHTLEGREVLMSAGGTPQRIYFVAKGWLSGAVRLTHGLQPISHIHIRSDVIGLSWLNASNLVEDVVALTPCELISVPMEPFRAAMRQDPLLQDYVLGAVVRDMTNMQLLSAVTGHMKAPDRLAYFLIIMLNRCRRVYQTQVRTLNVPMTQEDIGRMLGLTNVSVNRAFRVLEAEDLIETSRQSITLLDENRLAERCEMDKHIGLMEQLVGEVPTLTRAA